MAASQGVAIPIGRGWLVAGTIFNFLIGLVATTMLIPTVMMSDSGATTYVYVMVLLNLLIPVTAVFAILLSWLLRRRMRWLVLVVMGLPLAEMVLFFVLLFGGAG